MKTFFKNILLGAILSFSIASCSKDKESNCEVTDNDYVGTYFGKYSTSVGINNVTDTLTVSKGSNSGELNIYSSRMGMSITAKTNCQQYTINSFSGVKFAIDYNGTQANVLDGTATGKGQLSKNENKLNVTINFSTITVDFGTGPGEYKNTLNLTGDFIK